MFEGTQEIFLYIIFAAFMLGWMVAKFGVWVSNRARKETRDPRDDRIRSLEAEHRIAKTDSTKAVEQAETLKQQFQEAEETIKELEKVRTEQGNKITQLRKDLKDSVRKTRELRLELTDRATESVRSEVKLREVETELEVTRASTDLIATGVLDYSMAPDDEEDEGASKVSKIAT